MSSIENLPLATTQTYENCWANLADEMIVKCFSYLDPETLIHCQRVCSSWNQKATDSSFYQTFAQNLFFFIGKDVEKPREKFISYYRETISIKLAGKSHYESLRFVRSEGGKKILKEKCSALCATDNANPLINYSKFPYQEARPYILGNLDSQVLSSDIESTENPFYLACYFGDVEMVDEVLTKELDEKKRNDLLLSGFYAAIAGSQEEMWSYLDSKGINYNQEFAFGAKFMDFFYGNIVDLPIHDDIKKRAIEFLIKHQAQSTFFQ